MRQKTVPIDDVVVVIPYFNGSETIERALESVETQTVRPTEVIVVDDGSKKEEREFLCDLQKTFSFRLITQMNGGQGSARNTGVNETNAPLICFLDQDDFFTHDHIEILLTAVPKDRKNFGWAYGDLAEADFNGLIVRRNMIKDHSDHPKTNIIKMIGADMFVLPSASIICRNAFVKVGGFDTQFMGYEDDDLFLRLFRQGFKNYYIDQTVTVWCIHNASTSYSFRMTRSRFRYFMKLSDSFPDDPLKRRYYVRDLLVPRFNKTFFSDVRRSIFGNIFKTNRKELLEMYIAFSRKAIQCSFKSKRFHIKLILRHVFVVLVNKLYG